MTSLSQAPHKFLKVLHIAESYPPDYGGGAGISVQEICRDLTARGHEVRVLCVENTSGEPYTTRTEFDGAIRIDRINLPYFKTKDPDGWQLGLWGWIRHERRVGRFLKDFLLTWRPDLVHYHTTRPFGEEGFLAIRRCRVPIVAMLHEAWLICPRLMLLQSPQSAPCQGPGPLRCLGCLYSHYDRTNAHAFLKAPWRVLKLGLYPSFRLWRRRRARRCVAGANGVSAFLIEKHRPHLHAIARHIPLEVKVGTPPSPVQRPHNPLRFGFIGGFQPSKGIWHVLDAAANLRRRGLKFELHIWGPGQEQGNAEIAARGLEQSVFLHGMYAPEAIAQVYSQMDVAIMATVVCEALGRVPLEAAICGAPTIAPAIGGLLETIRDGVDGLHYAFRDPQDLERQMQRILETPGLLQTLIKNLKPASKEPRNKPAIEDLYFQVLGHQPAPRTLPTTPSWPQPLASREG